ncbi:MAG: FIVAR domain-containing protein [Candidatus Symbiothrix sp.]|jgi:hypothetical protein|nr:FIVAR domain-containing protein [Candidatus Symbiothrix sp.]
MKKQLSFFCVKRRMMSLTTFVVSLFVLNSFAQTDVTELIVNPDFEAGTTITDNAPDGWFRTGNGTSKISTAAKGDGSVVVDGENHWQIWGGPFTCDAYQTISEIPNGTYRLRFGCYMEFATDAYLYANTTKTPLVNATSDWYEADAIVQDGTLRIGVSVTDGTVFEIDHFSLTFYGTDLSMFANQLSGLITTAQSLQSAKMTDGAATTLTDAITQAQTTVAEDPLNADHLNEAIAQITSAINEANLAVAAYENLQIAIDSAQTVYSASGIDADILQNAIATAQTANTNLTLTVADVNAATATLYQAVLAYRIENAGAGNPIDMSSFIVNPNFNSSNTGWSWNTGASSTGTFTAETKTDLAGGTYGDFVGGVWENWASAAFSGKMYQAISGLPNGKYRLSASVYANKTWEEAKTVTIYDEDGVTVISTETPPYQDWLFLYANNDSVAVTDPKSCLTYSLEVNVYDGTMELGIVSPDVVTNWFAVDNFYLEYLGYDMTAASAYLQERITFASDYTDGDVMQGIVLSELNAAINNANGVVSGTPTKVTIESATSRLQAAISAAESSMSAYATLKTAIDDANTAAPNYAAFPGYAAYLTAITTAQGAYNDVALDEAGVAAAVEALRVASVTCQLTQPAPFDASFALYNPSFELGVYSTTYLSKTYNAPTGWQLNMEYVSSLDSKLSQTNPHDGVNLYNAWSGNVIEINLYQELHLPAGEYELSAVMRSEYDFVNDTQELYAAIGLSEYTSEKYIFNPDMFTTDDFNLLEAWMPLSVEFAVTSEEETVILGARSYGDGTTAGGWFQIDDFRLQCKVKAAGINSPSIAEKTLYAYGTKGGVQLLSHGASDVRIYSVTGQLVKTVSVDGSATVALAPGVYFVNKQKVVVSD